MDFVSMPYHVEYYLPVFRRPDEDGGPYLKPFKDVVWLAVGLSIPFTAAFLCCFNRCSNQCSSLSSMSEINQAALFTFGALFMESMTSVSLFFGDHYSHNEICQHDACKILFPFKMDLTR